MVVQLRPLIQAHVFTGFRLFCPETIESADTEGGGGILIQNKHLSISARARGGRRPPHDEISESKREPHTPFSLPVNGW